MAPTPEQQKIANQMFLDPRDIIKRRGLGKRRLGEMGTEAFAGGQAIGMGTFNRLQRQLSQGGLQRSGVRFAAPARAANVQGQFLTQANRSIADLDQNVADRNYGFDLRSLELMRERVREDFERRRKDKFNPLKAFIDIAKFGIPLIPGVGPAAGAGMAAMDHSKH